MEGSQINQLHERVCVFVSSSDRTRDVFERVFAGFHRCWQDCPFQKFVGLTSSRHSGSLPDFLPVFAEAESGWRSELKQEVAKLPARITHLILLLDDFLLLKPVQTADVLAVCGAAIEAKLSYVRLRPVERSIWIAAFRRCRAALTGRTIEILSRSEPYYSSLQAALWSREHLLESLGQPGNIWDFEHWVPPAAHHYAATRRILCYRHVVEKGKWRGYAAPLLRAMGLAFDPGSHEVRPAADRLRYYWERLKFGLFGYAGTRAKRRVRSLVGAGTGPRSS